MSAGNPLPRNTSAHDNIVVLRISQPEATLDFWSAEVLPFNYCPFFIVIVTALEKGSLKIANGFEDPLRSSKRREEI